MVVLENCLFLNGIFYAVLGLVGRFLRLEVHQTAHVLPVFKDMHHGICRPFALIAGVIAACAARPAVFQRSRRWDFLLGQHTGYLGRTVPGKAQTVYPVSYTHLDVYKRQYLHGRQLSSHENLQGHLR